MWHDSKVHKDLVFTAATCNDNRDYQRRNRG